MSTKALDVTTIFHALETLEKRVKLQSGFQNSVVDMKTYLGSGREWSTDSPEQEWAFGLYRRFYDVLGRLHSLKSKASTDWEVLNAYLVANGFDKMFDGPLDGIGAVSILDMLVEWLHTATLCDIYGMDRSTYPGFKIPVAGVEIYQVEGFDMPLARLATKSGDPLWLLMVEKEPATPIDAAKTAFAAIGALRELDRRFAGVEVPMVDINIKPDISFLCGANTTAADGQWWYIDQAFQQFVFKMNERGARAKVATGIAMRKGVSFGPTVLHINRPFVGWFTQQGVPDLPIACFYADYDSWKQVASLDM